MYGLGIFSSWGGGREVCETLKHQNSESDADGRLLGRKQITEFLKNTCAGADPGFSSGGQRSFDPKGGPEPKMCSKLPENCMSLKKSCGAGPPGSAGACVPQ